ncbi:MAG: DUF1192 domain-containing protein [Hyphomicrobiaceae bacterium]
MDWDDTRPKAAKSIVVGEDLKRLSVAELESRIVALEQEIVRTRAELTAKRTHEQAASSLFKR